MKVLKFGGASVKDAAGVKNLLEILKTTKNDTEVVIVVSAMGKTTRKLTKVAYNYIVWEEEDYGYPYDPDANDESDEYVDDISWNSQEVIKNYHLAIMSELFDENHIVFKEIESYFDKIKTFLRNNKDKNNENFVYDQIISFGELISSKIIYHYLKDNGFDLEWLDARELIKTDGNYGNANVNIEKTKKKITKAIDKTKNYITQGFIGSNKKATTTLGFEGSDYSAALFASILNSESITIWKDVPGVFNADPRYFRNYLYAGETSTFERESEENRYKALQLYGPVFLFKPLLLGRISYCDAAKMAHFGASVIHPKTIQPLQEKKIPLYVKSFLKPKESGTEISNRGEEIEEYDQLFKSYSELPEIPYFMVKKNIDIIEVYKENQFSVNETDLGVIYSLIAICGITIELIQNTVDRVLICIESGNEFYNFKNVLQKSGFYVSNDVYFPKECYSILLTILYPNPKAIENILKHIDEKDIVMQQSSEDIFQLVIGYDNDR